VEVKLHISNPYTKEHNSLALGTYWDDHPRFQLYMENAYDEHESVEPTIGGLVPLRPQLPARLNRSNHSVYSLHRFHFQVGLALTSLLTQSLNFSLYCGSSCILPQHRFTCRFPLIDIIPDMLRVCITPGSLLSHVFSKI
jgi:hypothetical protein